MTKHTTERHIQSKHEGVTYLCDQCSYKDNVKSNLVRHKQSNHEGVRFECDKCSYKFRRLENLKDHKQSVHEGILRACDHCKFTTKWRPHLIKHKKIHTENENTLSKCGQCGIMFRNDLVLKVHIGKMHKKGKMVDVKIEIQHDS